MCYLYLISNLQLQLSAGSRKALSTICLCNIYLENNILQRAANNGVRYLLL